MGPRVSVLICACDRPRRLARLLGDLERQSVDAGDLEVVVADDGSAKPEQREVLRRDWALDLRVVRGPRRGPAAARNRALQSLRAPLCLLLNDDLRASPELVAAHLRIQDRRRRRPLALMGPFEFTDELRRDPFHRVVEDLGLIGTRRIHPGAPLGPELFWSGNLSLRTEDLLAVGGFDETFAEPKGDDVDLGHRLANERGVGLRLSLRPRAWHDHRHTVGEWWERARMVGRAQRRIAEKHRDPHFCPGSGAVLFDEGERRAARERLLAQRSVGRELIEWTERVACGEEPAGEVEVPSLSRRFRLPRDREALLSMAAAGATHYLFQEGFWGGEPS